MERCLNRCLNGDGSLHLPNNPIFSPPNSDYILPGASSIGPMNKYIIRGDNAYYSRKFDSGNITRVEITDLRDKPRVYVTDGTIAFFGRWLLRNSTTDLEGDIARIPPSLADLLRQLFQLVGEDYQYIHSQQGEFETTLGHIDKYLYGHPDLLECRLIFFICNEARHRWFGLCAVNPWRAVIEAHKKQKSGLHKDFLNMKGADYRAGIFVVDSGGPAKGRRCMKELQPWLWLLNMMSHYCDIKADGKRN
jgi:hypothetical protein